MNQSIGRCGNCGGQVTVPTTWYGTRPPIPSCGSCGSTPQSVGPAIPMNPRPAGWPGLTPGTLQRPITAGDPPIDPYAWFRSICREGTASVH